MAYMGNVFANLLWANWSQSPWLDLARVKIHNHPVFYSLRASSIPYRKIPLFFTLDFCLDWAGWGLVYLFSPAMNSYVQLPWSTQNHSFLAVINKKVIPGNCSGLFLLSLHVNAFLIPVLMICADSQIKTDYVLQYGHESSTPYC